MKRLLLALILAGFATASFAQAAYDAFSTSTFDTNAGTLSWTHTPSGTPRGVVVCQLRNNTTTTVTGITYGGSSMTELSCSPNTTGGEQGNATCYFLGASVPTGAQTVEISNSGGSGPARIGYAVSVTASNDTEVSGCDASITGVTSDPSATLGLGGKTSFVAMALHSGQNDVTGVTPLTNWTAQDESDVGTKVEAFYSYDTIGSTDVTVGWTQTNDDVLAIAFGIAEQGGAPPPAPSNLMLLGVGP